MAANTGLTASDVSAGDDGLATQYNALVTDTKKLRQESMTAGATINGATLPVPVFQNTSDNEVYACDADDSTTLKFLGFAITDGTNGNAIIVQHTGVVGGFSSLDEGELYYVQNDKTVGRAFGTYAILVGEAISTTQILIIKESRLLDYVVGAGERKNKRYWNFELPFILYKAENTATPQTMWSSGNLNSPADAISTFSWFQSAAGNNFNYALTTDGIFHDLVGTTPLSGLEFSDNKEVIVEFGLKVGGTGVGSGWGLVEGTGPLGSNEEDTDDAVCFHTNIAGNLYAHVANNGVGFTNTQITGITLTNMNTYRIEWDPANSEARFYINGVLEVTMDSGDNLPDGDLYIKFGWGAGGTTGNSDQRWTTAPQFSIEK